MSDKARSAYNAALERVDRAKAELRLVKELMRKAVAHDRCTLVSSENTIWEEPGRNRQPEQVFNVMQLKTGPALLWLFQELTAALRKAKKAFYELPDVDRQNIVIRPEIEHAR